MSLSKRIISFVMLFSISLTSILPSFNILNAQKEEKTKENVEEQNTNSFSSEAFEPIKFEKSRRSKRSVDILEVEDYIRENLKTDIVENNILEKFQKKDGLTVTTTVIDGTLLKNATLKDLNKDENKDNIQDNYKAIANQTTSNIPLFEVSKESKYLVGKVIGKLQNAKVTDIAFAKNNANAQMLNDIIFDKETSLVYVPKTYTEKPLSVRTQIIVTTDEKPTKAKSEINVFVDNKNVKDILVKTSKAYGNLQSVSTDIVLQEKEAKDKLTEEKIDSVEINKVKFTKEDKAYKYDEKERKLILFVSPVGVTEVKINLSKTVLKSAKNTLNKLATSLFSKKSYAANVSGVMKMQNAPREGKEYILTAEVKHHGGLMGEAGYTDPLVVDYDLNEGDFENKTGKRVRGDWDFSSDSLTETSTSLARSAHIEEQTVDGVDFPEMRLNLVCSHIDVDSFGSDIWSNAKFIIRAVRGDEVVVGVLTPTVYDQAGAGFFRIKWRKKISPKQPTKAYIKKINEQGEAIANAKFEMSYTSDFLDPNQKWTYTTNYNGETTKDEWNMIGKTVYVREISVPSPYIKTDEVKSFVVGSSSMIKLTFINKKRGKPPTPTPRPDPKPEKKIYRFYNLKIVKKDSDSYKTLKGAEFEIIEKNTGKLIETVTTDSDGSAKTKDLDSHLPCIIKEKKAPDGYEKNETSYTINKSDFSYSYEKDYEDMTFKYYSYEKTIYNKKKPTKGKVKIFKKGNVIAGFKDEKVTIRNKTYTVKKPIYKVATLPGAKFRLYKKDDNRATNSTDFISTKEGTELILEEGKYKLIEEQAPDGYEKAKSTTFIVKANQTTNVEVFNNLKKDYFNLQKEFETGKFKHETYAVFGLFAKENSGNLKKDDLIDVLEFTKENPKKEFKNIFLPRTKLYLKEIDNSSSYIKDNSKYNLPTINEDDKHDTKGTITILNKLKHGGIKITKVDSLRKDIKLSSVEFKLSREGQTIGTYTTDENGEITINNLEIGEYKLVETKTKEGYILDTKERIIRVKDNNVITEETISNKPTRIKITKVGKDDTTKQLEGAEFEIIEVEDEEKEDIPVFNVAFTTQNIVLQMSISLIRIIKS